MRGIKAVQCKECGVVFSEENPKYGGSAHCKPCQREYMRKRTSNIPKTITDEFKLENRKNIYTEKRIEISKIKDRDEWRALLTKRLDEALKELNKHLII